MVILQSVWVLFVWTKTITLFGKPAGILRNVDKVPTESFRAIVPDVVRPNCNRGQIIIAQQFFYVQSRSRS